MLCPVLWCERHGKFLIMRAARPLTEAECEHLKDTDGFPDWDYMPSERESEPFEHKPLDWGYLDSRLVALDYSAPALFD